MYIRSKEEALGVMARILELPARPAQIVESTVQVALCMTSDARDFMLDVQAAVIGGGLEALKKRREEALAKLTETKIRRRAPGVDVRKDPVLDQIGLALDLLKMVEVVVEVFPALVPGHPKWEVARFIHENESYVREAVEAGLRRRGRPEHADLERKVLARIEEKKPWWPEWAESIRQACAHYVKTLAKAGEVHPRANDPELLFAVICMSEERAREVLDRMARTSAELEACLAGIRARLDLVLTAQEEAAR
jgi:hypothetical protein